jgi:hypothetical protein
MNTKSESESRNENHCQYKQQNFKSENKIKNNKNKDMKAVKVRSEEALNFKSENKIKNNKNKDVKAVKVRSEEALTKIKAKLTAKVNEVKVEKRP